MTDHAERPLFQHGVASGDPTPRRVVIWTRITPRDDRVPAAALWRVLEAETGRPIANGQTRVRVEADNTIRVDVGGLSPDTRYTYEFEVEGEPSPQGRTRTLPEGEVAAIRFAQVSCAKLNAGQFSVYARLAERDDLAFLLHLGDWIHEASPTPPVSQTTSRDIGRPLDAPGECLTLEDYRARYALYRRDPDVQAVSAAHPVISTIDDHELADGAWREGATEHRPERDGPWPERRAAAFRAREEWLPVRRPDMADPERAYRSIPIGGLAELFMLDTRTRRDQPVPPPALSRKGRSALGPEQKAWLLDALRASRARWRLIGNPSVMAPTWNDALADHLRQALVKVELIDGDGTGPDSDGWDGYPHERRELLEAISKLGEANVVVLSGDVHVGLAAELAETPADPPVAVEFVNTGLTSHNLDDRMGWTPRKGSREVERAVMAGMPHLRYIDLDSRGYSIVDLDREQLRFEWWTVDALETRLSGQAPAAVLSVRHGSPHLVVEGEPTEGAASEAPQRQAGRPRKPTPADARRRSPVGDGSAKPAPAKPTSKRTQVRPKPKPAPGPSARRPPRKAT